MGCRGSGVGRIASIHSSYCILYSTSLSKYVIMVLYRTEVMRYCIPRHGSKKKVMRIQPVFLFVFEKTNFVSVVDGLRDRPLVDHGPIHETVQRGKVSLDVTREQQTVSKTQEIRQPAAKFC